MDDRLLASDALLRKDPVCSVLEAEWAPGHGWTGAEILFPTGVGTPNHPTHIASLYQLRHPDPVLVRVVILLLYELV